MPSIRLPFSSREERPSTSLGLPLEQVALEFDIHAPNFWTCPCMCPKKHVCCLCVCVCVMRLFFTSKVALVIFFGIFNCCTETQPFQNCLSSSLGDFVVYFMSIGYLTDNLSPYIFDTTLVKFLSPQQIMVSITMQSITAVCFGFTIRAWKVFMRRLPHHIHRLSLQWFRPHPEVLCMATNFVGLILMFFSCESKPAARTSGTACNIELQSNKSSHDLWKTASPQHAQNDCHHLFQRVSGIVPELA